MWQAEHIRSKLMSYHNELDVEIIGVKTTGDIRLDVSLQKIGGKGLFVKELEHALLNDEADVAVHSLKDVPATFPEGLGIVTICERENPFDAWVCPKGFTLDNIPAGSRVGTSSLRRMVQLKAIRSDLIYEPLRGNVDSRLRKCQSGEWDAIILAVAGMVRLNLQQHITAVFNEEQLVPAVGQGALGLECRLDDKETQTLLSVLDHAPTRACVEAERAMNAALGGNCQVPVAGFAQIQNNQILLHGKVGHPERAVILTANQSANLDQSKALGQKVAQDLIAQGAKELITDILDNM
jgi:hydroxymethylbilane synthase